ncbi:MAG: hypothetical protein H6737_16950 [Alphaproteobacteria bacterium]|nr:hypothetical protein [Alphaproteobacteria bacterium]
MSEHVPEDLLVAFVEGEMGEQLSIHIAEHLDSCPMCATRAACLEPLGPAFAAMEDPEVPEGLAAAVLAAAAEEERPPQLEIAVGIGLLVAAIGVFVLLGEPLALASHGMVWLGALSAAGKALLLGLPSPIVMLPVTVVLGAASALLFARAAWPDALPEPPLRLAGRRLP